MTSPTNPLKDSPRSASTHSLRSPERPRHMEAPQRASISGGGGGNSSQRDQRGNALALTLSPGDSQRSVSTVRSSGKAAMIPSVPTGMSPPAHRKAPSIDFGTASTGSGDWLADDSYRRASSSDRAPSTDTIRGPPTTTATPPLTPFPPWVSDEEEDEVDDVATAAAAAARDRWLGAAAKGGEARARARRPEMVMRAADGLWMFNSVMHGVVLALQCVVALGVFSVLAWVTVWEKNGSDDGFTEWLWRYAEPAVGLVLIINAATLLAHEIKVLSGVALLYFQSGILLVTTIAGLILWMRCFNEDSVAVKGVLMGCNLFMWVFSFFAFIRSVVLWKVEAEMDAPHGLLGPGVVSYGTLVPWDDVSRV